MLPSFAIIGGGFGGIDAAIKTRRGNPNARIVVFDEAPGFGGAWQWNRYPGVACDVPSHLYSLSHELNPDWPDHYSGASDIRAYLQSVAKKHGLDKIARLSTRVVHLEWLDEMNQWKLTAEEKLNGSRQTVDHFDYVISANGPLHVPKYPSIHGLESFEGEVVHTARWKPGFENEIHGKRVAVIGTGASAVQAVPEIEKVVETLVVFQRHAAWPVPKEEYKYSKVAKWIFRNIPFAMRLWRFIIFWLLELRYWIVIRRDSAFSKLQIPGIMKLVTQFIESQVRDPVKREQLTPDYPFGARRIPPSNSYLKALDSDKTTLVSGDPISHITDGNTIVTQSGRQIQVDAIILATGFELLPVNQPFTMVGRKEGGVFPDLSQIRTRTRPRAYMFTTMPQFPNFFMILGPNAAFGHMSVLIPVELQTDYTLRLIRASRDAGRSRVEVTTRALEEWDLFVQKGFKGTVWEMDKSSWYYSGKAENFTLWPYSCVYMIWLLSKQPKLMDYVDC
ncbi:hypothetical protein BC830DRAFT_1143974 [Chytriomyces sp. MP71]|nr:hypothetical protein BC830DRAFT_1143974 [Chytriomyces sp. MP71]